MEFLKALSLNNWWEFGFATALLVLAIALIVLVMMQSGKDKRLSGTIAGGAETFFGKNKTADNDKVMTIVTAVISAVFVCVVLVMYFFLATR